MAYPHLSCRPDTRNSKPRQCEGISAFRPSFSSAPCLQGSCNSSGLYGENYHRSLSITDLYGHLGCDALLWSEFAGSHRESASLLAAPICPTILIGIAAGVWENLI